MRYKPIWTVHTPEWKLILIRTASFIVLEWFL